jgi:hypothetical protein
VDGKRNPKAKERQQSEPKNFVLHGPLTPFAATTVSSTPRESELASELFAQPHGHKNIVGKLPL